MVKPYVSEEVLLDPEMRSPDVLDFERRLLGKLSVRIELLLDRQHVPDLLGGYVDAGTADRKSVLPRPTGSGKTRVVEASAEILFGSPRAFIKMDCAEFQHSHEIAKLIGSPPGYLGHRETPPLLTQEAIDQFQTDRAQDELHSV